MLTLIRCPFHPRVTAVARKIPRSFCQKCSTPKHAYTFDPTKLEWADCRRPGIGWESFRKRAHTQAVREHSVTVVLACCGLTLAKRMELMCASKSPLKKKRKKAQAGNELSNILPKSSHARKKANTTPSKLDTNCLGILARYER